MSIKLIFDSFVTKLICCHSEFIRRYSKVKLYHSRCVVQAEINEQRDLYDTTDKSKICIQVGDVCHVMFRSKLSHKHSLLLLKANLFSLYTIIGMTVPITNVYSVSKTHLLDL